MSNSDEHKFHIPVLGIGYSIDTPVKVARYGISSVLSIGDDELLEKVRKHYLSKLKEVYIPISNKEEDSRAKRTTAYLNLINKIVKDQFNELKKSEFTDGSEICKYIELLPDSSALKLKFNEMLKLSDPKLIEETKAWIRNNIKPGNIEVNIMTKLDKTNYSNNGEALPVEYNDAHAAIRGFAKSDLSGSIILSAGMNPRLFSYMETLPEFYPDSKGLFSKRVVIKVSDFRSALIQGKFLAKKGIWVSEYRVESGLNCGGHAFATDGYLLGPILEEFKNKRTELLKSVKDIFLQALALKKIDLQKADLKIKITVQGGVGLFSEQEFLLRYYEVNSVGWGSPFLLVPEVINIDTETMQKLSEAGEDDIYLSRSSPLGVRFYNLRTSSKEIEKAERIINGKYGSPCTKNYLKFNTDYSDRPICTASIQFQKRKIEELNKKEISADEFNKEFQSIVEKECLCEGLTSPVLIVNNIVNPKISSAVSVCPGPNLAYFSKIATLKEMVDHIYGRINLITNESRPNMFIKELSLYLDYFNKMVEESIKPFTEQTEKTLKTFKENLLNGINYYKDLIPKIFEETEFNKNKMLTQLINIEKSLIT